VSGIRIKDLPNGNRVFCKYCVYAKATRKPIAKECQGEHASKFGDEIHTDLWGPAPVPTIRGRCYYVSFTDDATCMTYLYFLRTKDETFSAYREFEAVCETQHGAHVKVLHSDHGGEYTGKAFVMHLKTRGTRQKLTVHDTPEHNGVAECLNHTILEKVRAMLHSSGQPKFLWAEAARHTVWLKNCTPTKALDFSTPYAAAYGKPPDLSTLYVWGCRI
jgi:hypothetical protein